VAAGRSGSADPFRRTLQVEAEPTVFYANPDGRRNLVRFYAGGVDAPAGRLRVFDARNRLIGTAGLLRRGERLYGELWLALDGVTRVRSELEAPGVRGVFRTSHGIAPPARWALRWIVFGDPRQLERDLHRLDPFSRAATGALLLASKTRARPFEAAASARFVDHFDWLRSPLESMQAAQSIGIDVGSVAAFDRVERIPWTAITVLAAAGVSAAMVPWSDAPTTERWSGPDGASLRLLRRAPGSDARSLGLSGDGDMMQAIERWLTTTPELLGSTDHDSTSGEREALIVDVAPCDDLGRALMRVSEWNRRFAYPRIQVGSESDSTLSVPRPSSSTRAERPVPVVSEVPEAVDLLELADERERTWMAHAALSSGIAAALLPGGLVRPPDTVADVDAALNAIGAEIQSPFSGIVVWNPTPHRRTDVIESPDGTQRYVTDVPAHGYAFLVDTVETAATPEPERAALVPLEGDGIRALVDEQSGAIRSLVDDHDSEWVSTTSDGLNAVPGSRLERIERLPAPPNVVRLRLYRWSPEFGNVITVLTTHRRLPWIDVENSAAPLGTRRIDYYFGFDVPDPLVRWELPVGWDEATAPIGPAPHLRWIALHGSGRTAWLACTHTGYATVDADGLVVSHAPRRSVRYRLGAARYTLTPADMSRLGWSVVPLRSQRAPARPDGRLPRDGTIIEHSDPEVAVLGTAPASDGDGIIVYLQNLSLQDQYVGVSAGLVGFQTATAVDLLERPLADGVSQFSDGFVAHLRSRGIAAVRLGSTYLRGA